jgi:pyridoxal phosphate enzyme (YggS family)
VSIAPEPAPSPTAADVIANLDRVRQRIAVAATSAGRRPEEITLVAVTKTVAPDLIAVAQRQGVTAFGENRVQEARPKIQTLPTARWELIGTLQRNKARAAVALFTRIQSVDSLDLAGEIERVAAERDIVMPVLLQVNVAGELTKHGVALNDVAAVAQAIAHLPHLRGVGLMTIAPAVADPEAARPVFVTLREVRDQLRNQISDSWQELSMGMTDDFAVAIAEGATIVRIGRAIFGARQR